MMSLRLNARPVLIGLLAMAILLLVTACENFDPGLFGRTAAEAVVADQVVQTGLPQAQVRLANLNEDEITTLDAADALYNQFREKWGSALSDPEFIAVNVLSFEREFEAVKAAYQRYYDIVALHWDEYPAPIQTSFQTYDTTARRIGMNVAMMLEGNSLNEAVVTSLQYVTLAAQLGLI